MGVGAVFVTTGIIYGVACLLYLLHLVRGNETAARQAHRVLFVAVVSHFVYLGLDFLTPTPSMGLVHQTLTGI